MSPPPPSDADWIRERAGRIATGAEQRLATLVDLSSPSGDVEAAEAIVAAAAAMLPASARVDRLPCSSPGHAPDLLASVTGSGSGRLLLLGHLDTVFSPEQHRPLTVTGDRLLGSGTIDMKGGVVLSLGVFETLAAEPERFAELALLLVNDEEWRREPFSHGPRFEGWDACLCFEGGELNAGGDDAVVVRRKAAGTIKADATGQAAHSGARPEDGRNALLALAELARRAAGFNDPEGPGRLTAVPTILRSGHAFNVVPGDGELAIDLRADRSDAFDSVVAGLPGEIDGVELDVRLIRVWPGMDTRERSAAALERAGALLGRPIAASSRGGASDASHVAPHVPLTIDGLGPLGGGAHTSAEYLLASSLGPRSEVALALASAILAPG